MNSHDLAKILLDYPNFSISIMSWSVGKDYLDGSINEIEYLWWCPKTKDFLELVIDDEKDSNTGYSNEYDKKGRFVASVERIENVKNWLRWVDGKGFVRCQVMVLADSRLVSFNGKTVLFNNL